MSGKYLITTLMAFGIMALLILFVGVMSFVKESKELFGYLPKGEGKSKTEGSAPGVASTDVTRETENPKPKRVAVERPKTEEDKKNKIPDKTIMTETGTIERVAKISEIDERNLSEYSLNRIKGERTPPKSAVVRENFIQWQVNLGGSVSGAPVVYKKNLYFGCTDYQMLCLDKETGEMVFQAKTNSQAIGNPYRYKDIVIISQRNGNISAYDVDTGKRKWNHRIAVSTPKDKLDISISGVSVLGGYIYVSKHWGNLYILKARDGLMVSAPGVPYESRINLPAITFDGNVLFNNVAGELHCFDKSGKEHKWTHAIENGYPITMKYGDNKIFIANTEKELFALDSKTKETLWSKDTAALAYDSLIYDNFNIYVGAGNFYAIDADRGDILWEITPRGSKGFCRGTPVIDGEFIYMAEQDGIIHKIQKDAGTSVEVFNIGGEIMNPLVKDGELLFFSTTGKKLMAINLSSNKGT